MGNTLRLQYVVKKNNNKRSEAERLMLIFSIYMLSELCYICDLDMNIIQENPFKL